MNKQEYFESRLLQDSRQFLLSNKQGAAKRLLYEVSVLLESLLYDGQKSIYANCVKRIDALLDANFGNKSDLVGLQRLPKGFRWMDVCTAINKDFDAELEQMFARLKMSQKVTALLQPRVECWVWTEGIEPTAKMLARVPVEIGIMVQSYRPDHLDDYPLKKEIGEMFVDAKRVSLREWVLKNGMREYTRCLLNATLYHYMKRLGIELKKLPLWGLSQKLMEAVYQLQNLQEKQPVVETNPKWEMEYNRLVSVDFYFRNVESVTASGAFHLMVLQALSRNESKLTQLGYLKPLSVVGTEPEIRIFSNPDTRYPDVFEVIDNVLKTLLS